MDGYRPILTTYIEAAMARAEYKQLEDGTWFGTVPELTGLWANTECREDCALELREALEEWILVGLRLDHPFPRLADIDLSVKAVA